LAKKTKHATTKQAAEIAKQANAKQLIIGHYSGRYKDINVFKQEAQEIFENTNLAEPGKIFKV
jgi:ribonuclease Z